VIIHVVSVAFGTARTARFTYTKSVSRNIVDDAILKHGQHELILLPRKEFKRWKQLLQQRNKSLSELERHLMGVTKPKRRRD
jgi:PHD/YefM family antitoxin component YafN of YafNO toxin-antitoxin module